MVGISNPALLSPGLLHNSWVICTITFCSGDMLLWINYTIYTQITYTRTTHTYKHMHTNPLQTHTLHTLRCTHYTNQSKKAKSLAAAKQSHWPSEALRCLGTNQAMRVSASKATWGRASTHIHTVMSLLCGGGHGRPDVLDCLPPNIITVCIHFKLCMYNVH